MNTSVSSTPRRAAAWLAAALACISISHAAEPKRAGEESVASGSGTVVPRETRDISGWQVHVSRKLLEAEPDATARALAGLKQMLDEIARVVPANAVTELRKVPLYFSSAYKPGRSGAEFHPDAGWLRDNGRNPAMASGVEFSGVDDFEAEMRRMAFTVGACSLALLFTSGCSDKTPPAAATTPPTHPATISTETQKPIPEEDVAFFEKKYQKKITGVKPKEEYSDPDQFYSAIAVQLGIPEVAWEAAAAKFGWKKDDGKVTTTMVKGGPTAGGGQGTWDIMFFRFAVNPETKKPDPASMQQVMVQLDYDGNVKFPEVPKGNP